MLEVAEGLELDNADGVLDEVMLGIADISEGMLDGRNEGSFVGDLVGGGLGTGVGLFVGLLDGPEEGIADGAADILGWLLGMVDGATDRGNRRSQFVASSADDVVEGHATHGQTWERFWIITLAVVQFVVAVVAALFAQAAIRQADHGVAVCILMKQFVARILTGAGGTRDSQLVGAFIARRLTGEVTAAATVPLDAGCGFVAGFVTHATIVAACLVARRRVVRAEVAFEAIDPGTVGRTGWHS